MRILRNWPIPRIRNWPIRAKIIVLVVPPLVSLFALWIFATSVMVGPAMNLLNIRTNSAESGRPAAALFTELQQERKASLVYLGSGRVDLRPLTEQRAKTDSAANTFRTRATSEKMQDAANDLTKQRIRDVVIALDRLVDGRQNVDRGALDRTAAFDLYTSVIDTTYRIFGTLDSNEVLARPTRVLITLGRAADLMSQADAMLNGIAAAGKVQAGEPIKLAAVIASQRYVYAEVAPEFVGPDKAPFDQFIKGEAVARLRALEDKVITEARPGAALPIDMNAWRTTYSTISEQLRNLELAEGDRLVALATPLATGIFVRLGVAAILGLLAFLISLTLTIRVGRSLIRRLTGLRETAQNLADTQLPGVVARLRHGEDIDVEAEAPPLEFGTDEIGEVGKAFGAVQRTAVESAIQQAQLRRGLNEVFLNIARRSQTLLHRQLSLLDRMERRTNDPEELEDLFRVDHLATRMRRHAEDLVILAGAAPGRGWRNPVPMVDVIRGAVSEVEDYARVGLLVIPRASLVGRAVADVIHLLAEVIENATSYSPPHTRVQISGQLVPNGFAIEIEDRGLGMQQDQIDEANQRLRHPPDFDPANSAQLGLFVVALLAARHNIRVTLRSSPYGGVTAVVLVPPDLIEDAEDPSLPGSSMFDRRVLELEPVEVVPTPVVAAVDDVPEQRSEPVELTDDGLPRRHRQASLAPQLRDEDPQPPQSPAAGRSPEEIRDLMSSFQAGLVRGRRDAGTLIDDSAADEEGQP